MNHEEVQLFFESFFGGQAANIKSVLKTKLGSVQTRVLLNQIFQVVMYIIMMHYRVPNNMTVHFI